jgi:nucleoside-diphosphate-sugar epimerase
MIKKILVTGGAGYVGCIVVPMLLNKDYDVKVLDNLMYGQTTLLGEFHRKNFEFIKGDVRNSKTVKECMSGVDCVVHLSAIVGYPACKMRPELATNVNYVGTVNINKARKDIPIIFPSTGSIYGDIDGICTEESKIKPLTLYGETKYKAEKEITSGKNYVVFRPATAFGLSPRMRLDLLPNDFTYQAVKTNNLVVYEGNAKRTFIHVTDFARAIVHAIKNFDDMKNEVYNLGSAKLNMTKRDVAEKIKEIHDYYLHFAEFGTDPDKRDYEVSYEKLRATGFDVETSMEDGIKGLVKGYQMIKIQNPYSNYIR